MGFYLIANCQLADSTGFIMNKFKHVYGPETWGRDPCRVRGMGRAGVLIGETSPVNKQNDT